MSGPQTDRLQDAFRERRADSSGVECPDVDRVWLALAGETDPGELRAIIDHTAKCARCAELWRLAHRIGAMDEQAVATTTTRHRWLPLAAAALLVAGVAGLWSVLGPGRETPGVEFRAGEQDVIRSLVDEATPLPRGAVTLSWSGPEDAEYSLRVTTETLQTLVDEYRLKETQYTIAEERLQPVPPGGTLIWQVTAHRPVGPPERSQSFVVKIK